MKKIGIRLKQLEIITRYLILKIFNIFSNKEKYKNVWLISERGDEARDNGYAFYKYMVQHHPDKEFYYIISKKSPDIKKIDKSRIIYYQSNKHIKYYMNSKYLLSTHILGFSPEFRSFGKLAKKYKLFDCKGKKVFLQHGIIQSYIEYLTNRSIDLDLFICGAKPEYEFILNNFGFDKSVVKYTGLARYDYLNENIDNENKTILFMPTWRKELFYLTDEEFVKSEYYKNINLILQNNKLNNKLKENNIQMIFYPHYEIQKRIHLFKNTNENILIASSDKNDISELLKGCDMLITDYSSVFFDVAYQKKPISYFQYDDEEFHKNQYGEAYFKYNELGFGNVIYTTEELVNDVCKIIEKNFTMEDKYIKRVENFFEYNDRGNCERIYNEIINLKDVI